MTCACGSPAVYRIRENIATHGGEAIRLHRLCSRCADRLADRLLDTQPVVEAERIRRAT